VKRDELLRRVRRAAGERGIDWALVRQISGHRLDVQRRLQDELGREWWQR